MKTILLIDSGNTRLKVGVIAAAGTTHGRDDHAARAGGDILAHALDNEDTLGLNHWLAALPQAPVAALATNVAGPARAGIIEAALAEIGCPLLWIVPQAQAYGLTSRYTTPEQLGADRWVSMLGVLMQREGAALASAPGISADGALGAVSAGGAADSRSLPRGEGIAGGLAAGGASAQKPAPFLLASFGTATTLDTVSADGVFEGGLILPGPVMMRQSLASGTANLPLAKGDAMAFPTNTQHAIASGVAAAQAGAVLRQWLAGLQRYGVAPQLYATGGGWHEAEAEIRRLFTAASAAMGRLPPSITVIEHPVLHGLAHIAAVINLGAS